MTASQAFAVAAFAVATWSSAQLWFAQLVIYPLFAKVGVDDYVAYHRSYSRRIPLPVILPGFASFLMPLLLAWLGPPAPNWLTAVDIACGLVGFVVTVALDIPRHTRLEKHGRDDILIGELVRFKWPRTLARTITAGCCMVVLIKAWG
ncbi:hypothetical protein [Rhizobium indigoferae]|uniref:DUF1772 domain-containing protein n=1 Tax=Rhizobium indigoferae TaxID=158891 RepID=A0ABZ1DSP4_9HYPH|nr:hypothetical protein [Rhizobium indigoferae]NNU55920.1 hypothetical protein [Rhizobium indigoferae]WRW39250.1 hypothetical protein U5G49_006313 [Rhizobium indigoferae]GLR57379.1 hypothetical protein GCM10007919_21040 [Rhizobium indigoferae]